MYKGHSFNHCVKERLKASNKLKLQLLYHILKTRDQLVSAIRRIYQISGAWARFLLLPPQKEQPDYQVGKLFIST